MSEFNSAPEKNDPEALYELGMEYLKGDSIEQNFSEAKKLFEKAAIKNHLKAINELAFLYENGKDVPQSYTEAAKWYEKGIKLGDIISMN